MYILCKQSGKAERVLAPQAKTSPWQNAKKRAHRFDAPSFIVCLLSRQSYFTTTFFPPTM
jgi:hypothetical protein